MTAHGALLCRRCTAWSNSRIGKLCQSLQQNEELASSIGVNVAYLRVIAYAISSFLGGVAGAIFVAISQSIYPSSFTVTNSVNFMLNCFLGGLGYVFGPMLGTLRPLFRLGPPLPDRRVPAADLLDGADRADAVLPNGLLSLRLPRQEGRAEAMAELLQVSGLTKRFGGLVAVNDVSFSVREREILSVIGPNGAGKSTLFKLISSFLRPTSGEVRFKGERISGLAPHIVARKGVVRTFQETTIFKSMTRARQRHHRPSSALQGQPARLLSSARRGPADEAAFGRSADEILEFLGLSALSATRSPATCRMAICARSASPSALPRTRRSCCSTSRSPG